MTSTKAVFGAIALSTTLLFALTPAGCSDDNRDRFIASFDAGPEADVIEASVDAGGVDPTLGGPCTDDAQCDDQIACTFDACDKALSRCRNTPDDAQCQDNGYCNGNERCVLRQGCAPGAVVTCQDDNPCTIDRCVEASKSCVRSIRDSDGDGDPDDHCSGGNDCDDTDPNVSSTRAEVCGNFRDDNCNGAVDEQPCAVPANDTCAAALAITTAGAFVLTTVATKPDYATSCATNVTGGQDIVVAITVPAGGAQDVVVRTRTSAVEVALALETTCGVSSTEIQCQRVESLNDARAIARSVAGGQTIYAVITTARESLVDLSVAFAAPTTKPANETCAAPLPVALDKAIAVSLIDAKADVSSACATDANGGDLLYSFTLAQKSDVRIFATATLGSGAPIVTLRDPTDCAGKEIACRVPSTPPLFLRSLAAGTHVFSVGGTNQLDASVVVKTYPATDPPAGETCATAPPLEPGKTVLVDLSNLQGAIPISCAPRGLPATSYALTLPSASDVLVVGRFATNELGTVSLLDATCETPQACSFGGTPQRASKRNVPAGSYRVVVADQLAQTAELVAFVRPTLAPVQVTGADACADVGTIPPTGGFFVGDTTNAVADFNAGCDSGGQTAGTGKDQLLKLTLTEKQRVVFDMSGSEFTTILDVRSGTPCPGIEVDRGCNVGAGSPERSFLDLVLEAGTYWVQIDGYAGAFGKWSLDVRMFPPTP